MGFAGADGMLRGANGGTKILSTILRIALQPSGAGFMTSREKLCVFTRCPEPGRTKTRLIPALGPGAAARLQRAMTMHALSAAAEVAKIRKASVEIRFAGGDEARMRRTFGPRHDYRSQGGGDLGERMRRCVRDGFASGAEAVVIVGSDVPGIDAGILDQAFEALRGHDLVIGPATDGGYYLVGLRREVPEIFRDMPWGTEHVFRRTLDAAVQRGVTIFTLPALADVDRPEDLALLREAWGEARAADALGRVSVIIPTLNEAANIESTLRSLAQEDPADEVIVVDGGSTDGTPEKAAACGARVVAASAGRASQMNAGAAEATGSILLFLHADTRVPGGFAEAVRATLDDPAVSAGAFRFRTDAPGRAMRLVEWGTNVRSSLFGWPYGDQGLFVKKRVFEELGGFAPLPIMEDLDLVGRLRRRGRVMTVRLAAVTSARRWRQLGIPRTLWRNQCMVVGFMLGIDANDLAEFYRRDGRPGRGARRGEARSARTSSPPPKS